MNVYPVTTATDPDDEQQERDARTDLCEACRPVDHATCSLDPACACCRTTIESMPACNPRYVAIATD